MDEKLRADLKAYCEEVERQKRPLCYDVRQALTFVDRLVEEVQRLEKQIQPYIDHGSEPLTDEEYDILDGYQQVILRLPNPIGETLTTGQYLHRQELMARYSATHATPSCV